MKDETTTAAEKRERPCPSSVYVCKSVGVAKGYTCSSLSLLLLLTAAVDSLNSEGTVV